MEQATVKTTHGSASRIRGENENSISGIDLGTRAPDEFQAVDVAGIAAKELASVGADDPANQNRQPFCQRGKYLGESGLLRQRYGDRFRLREQARHAKQLHGDG